MRQWEELPRRPTAVSAIGSTWSSRCAGLPDMVYAANGALSHPAAHHRSPLRLPAAGRRGARRTRAGWRRNGLGPVHRPEHVNEGEGDFLVVGEQILAGTGFRTTPAAHAEVARLTGLPVVSLELVDPRFYHLDTALAVLDDDTVAYYPGAFSVTSQATLGHAVPRRGHRHRGRRRGARPERRLRRSPRRADRGGHRARRPAGRARLRRRCPVDLSELLKGGGGVKCCTLEIRKAGGRPRDDRLTR